jgi:uncharacterized protein YjiS (DUF1127 family)
MVTIFYIAPRDESIDMTLRADRVQFMSLVDRKMNTIDTIRYGGTELHAGASARRGFVGRLTLVLRSAASQLDLMMQRRRGRLALMEMTDEQLKDIGISRCDAHREGIKAFWE